MAKYRISSPDGATYEITAPDDATQEQVLSYAQQNHIQQTNNTAQGTQYDPLQDMGTVDKALAGAGKAFMDAGRALHIADPSTDESKAIDAHLMGDTAAKVGNFGANVAMLAPTAAIPGANTLTGSAAIGALTGGALTEGNLSDRAKAAVLGAGGGLAGQGIARGLSRISAPNVSQDVKTLLNNGVSLTPGQIMGGGWKSTEEKLRSVLGLGDMITAAQKRGNATLTTAAANRSMQMLPNPQVTDEVGGAAVNAARQAASDSYDKLLPGMSANALDTEFIQKMADLRSLVKSLPEKEASQFDSIIQREIEQRMAPNGVVSGKNLKDVWAGLAKKGKQFGSSTDAYQKDLGDALKQASSEFRDLIQRANPQNKADLQAIDKAWKNMSIAKQAANSVAATGGQAGEEGLFNPSQLYSAVKANDAKFGNGTFYKGGAEMQDLSGAAKRVMANQYPDSGTVGRSIATILALVGGAALPAPSLVAGGLGALAYTKPGIKAMEVALAKRPELMLTLGDLLKQFALPAGISGQAFALSNN